MEESGYNLVQSGEIHKDFNKHTARCRIVMNYFVDIEIKTNIMISECNNYYDKIALYDTWFTVQC